MRKILLGFVQLTMFYGFLPAATLPVTSTADAGPGSLREVVAQAQAGDVVEFHSSTYGTPIVLQTPITIQFGITIVGKDPRQTILDGGGQTRLFIINAPDATVTIADLTLRNGYAADKGGGIRLLDGYLRFEYAEINDCTAGAGGGAIYSTDSLSVRYANLRNNRATGSDAGGGAILSERGLHFRIYKSVVRHSEASGSGGAILVQGEQGGEAFFRDNRIDSNYAAVQGGAVALQGGGVTDMYLGSMGHNTAEGEGGALSISGGLHTMRSIEMHHNVARGDGGGGIYLASAELHFEPGIVLLANRAEHPASSGGAILVRNAGRMWGGATMLRNVASLAGGGLAYYGDTESHLDLGGRVDSNEVTDPSGRGGGVFLTGGDRISIKGNYRHNVAPLSGGAIWNDVAELKFRRGASFSDNRCYGVGENQGGGAIYTESGSLSLRETPLLGNRAEGQGSSGGAILSLGGHVRMRKGIACSDNRSGGRGGAICSLGGLRFGGGAVMHNAVVGAGGRGGAFYVSGGAADLGGVDLRYNTAAFRGGAVWAVGVGKLSLNSVNIVDNLVYGHNDPLHTSAGAAAGGGVYAESNEIEIERSTIARNSVLADEGAEGGGLIDRQLSDNSVELSTIAGNTTTGQGGGLVLHGQSELDEVTLIFNQAEAAGGLRSLGGNLSLRGTALIDNRGGGHNPDIQLDDGMARSNGYNLLRPDDAHTVGNKSFATDVIAAGGKFEPLADNGGKTLTHRPAADSPAINAGRATTSSRASDQIDQPPVGGNREIGALEYTGGN